MAVGETILKITDYPIAYSIAFLFLKIEEIDPLTVDAFPYFLAAGIGAAFFTIVDPLGKLIKGYMSAILYENFKKHRKNEKILTSWSEIKGSFNTSAIETEKDKIVNIVYFLAVLMLLMNFISDDKFFENYFSSVDASGYECDLNCLQDAVWYSLLAVSFLSAIIGGLRAAYILGRAKIVATYHKCVNSPFVSDNTKQSLGEYIRLGDWETAKVWKLKIENEYISEIGSQKEREEKRQEHVNSIIQQFAAFKEQCNQTNKQVMLQPFEKKPSDLEYFDIEKIFKKFSNFDQLIQHCYSTVPNELYAQFLELVETTEKFSYELNQWFETRTFGLDKIIDSLSMNVVERNDHMVKGNAGQWINLQRLNEQYDDFIGYYEERKMTFTPRKKDNSNLYQVRFFDSSDTIRPRHDVVAELRETDAGKISAELGHLAQTLRNMNAGTQREHVTRIEKKLEKLTERVLDAHHIQAQPIQGYCEYCLTEQFWSKKEIPHMHRELEKIPDVVYDKSKFLPEWKKRKKQFGAI